MSAAVSFTSETTPRYGDLAAGLRLQRGPAWARWRAADQPAFDNRVVDAMIRRQHQTAAP